MEQYAVLRDLLVILAIGVVVAFALRKLQVPSLAGFIVAGILIGPKSLGLIADVHEVEVLAEIGVVLLLFSIGLELSLDKVRRLWMPILLGGSLQVGITILVTAGIALACSLSLEQGIFVGCMVAVSSTAIVLRGLEYRGEIDAPHGRFAVGVLVFQDLCVVPMIMAIPFLSGIAGIGWAPLMALGKAALVVVAVLVAAGMIVPRGLHWVAATGQRDLFVLAVFLVCLGTAWVVSLAGVSLALGAFLAGLVVAGSDYRHQALADLMPFREVLASLFFISVGMLLDPRSLLRDPLPVLGLLAAILGGKLLIILLVGLLMSLQLRVALITGLTLAQVGEFLFVLIRAAEGTGLVEGGFAAPLMMAAILSMLATPLLMYASPHIAAGVGRFGMLQRYLGVGRPESSHEDRPRRDHVIVAGYGVAGKELATALRNTSIPYAIVDLNAETIRGLIKQGEPAVFGDVTSAEVLKRLGIHDAKEIVIVINDPDAAMRGVQTARRLAPDLCILVRTRYVGEVEQLLNAGAMHVVPSEFESAVEIVSQVLGRRGVVREEVEAYVDLMHGRFKAKEG